jgi:hypothetical protein
MLGLGSIFLISTPVTFLQQGRVIQSQSSLIGCHAAGGAMGSGGEAAIALEEKAGLVSVALSLAHQPKILA